MPQTHLTTPQTDGFYMPAEWENHTACWMLFPFRGDNWRMGAKPAQRAWVEVATAISQFEPVIVGARREEYALARQMMPPQVKVVELSSNDAWMRDVGATGVINGQGELRGVDWGFNAWGGLQGGLYFPWDQDELIAQKMLEIMGVDRYRAPFVLEGGAIHVDGAGTLLTTAECVLNPNRNHQLSQMELENYLQAYLGIQKIIWLPQGLYNDETDGHIDNLACFVRQGEVLLSWTDDPTDPNYDRIQTSYDVLMTQTDAHNRPLTVHKILLPEPLYMTEEESAGVDPTEIHPRLAGTRLAGSYVNFYLPNGGVVMPMFGVPQDELALTTLQKIFPERRVVGVYSREILLGGGNIHCITQQQPDLMGIMG